MEAEQIAQYKRALIQIRDALQEDGPEAVAPNRGEEAAGSDDDGQPLNEMLQAIASGRNRNRTVVLGQVTEALEVIEQYPDEYGLCRECEEALRPGRLKLMPYTPLCVRCKTLEEEARTSGARKKLTDYV